MNPNEFHLWAIDPGGTIGWAHLVVDFRAFSRPEHKILRWIKSWDCGQLSGAEHAKLHELLRMIGASLTVVPFMAIRVVGEDFDKSNSPGSKENLFSPVRQNAILGWECIKKGIRFDVQARQMRTSVTRDRLKLWGFGQGFGPHEFDALSHGIVYLRRMKEESRSRPWKLSEADILNAYYDCNCADGKKCDLIHLR